MPGQIGCHDPHVRLKQPHNLVPNVQIFEIAVQQHDRAVTLEGVRNANGCAAGDNEFFHTDAKIVILSGF